MNRNGKVASFKTFQTCIHVPRNAAQETESLKLELQRLVDKSNWEETERRKLHNLVQELKVLVIIGRGSTTMIISPDNPYTY